MEHFLQNWGYLAVFALTLLSTMLIPVGSELAMIYGGVLASGQVPNEPHHLQLALVIVAALGGELVGSFLGYSIGYFGGRPLVDRLGKYVLLTHKDLDRAEAWLDRRGEAFVFFGRLIPLVRSFVSVAAGLGEMTVGKFAVFTVAACAIWSTALVSLGYNLGSTYQHVVKDFSYAGYVAAVLVVILIVGMFALRIRAVRLERGAGPAHRRR
ncbi:MAG TPA: DedA family protein [Acidimicrobiales bacterium]|jgi:membrane protein DedA with SNARE-associated domain|nr:DedA family protein [Acidimicrobiales bacterium]